MTNKQKFFFGLLFLGAIVLFILAFKTFFLKREKEFRTIELQNMPLAVGSGVGTEWFESWAREDDIVVFFGDNFAKIPQPRKGKVGWNVPSFAHVIETEEQWRGKIDVILYDYEMWEKTPDEEKKNPDWASKRAQQFCNERNLLLLQGSSWNMVTDRDPNIPWGKIDKEKLQTIAKNVDHYGFNATGLRKESPESYIEWIKQLSNYAREANPDIKIWAMFDVRNQTTEEMYKIAKQLEEYIDGISIMGNEKEIISEFISNLRG